MKDKQNIYDNANFFAEYSAMRSQQVNANELLEIPTIKRLLPDLKGKTILDLGCGAGGMTRYFAECGAKEVVGIDISENMIECARKETADKNITYKVMAMEDITSLNRQFDLVFSSLAFHYVADFNKLCQDIATLLAPGGMLLFSQEHPNTTAPIRSENVQKHYEFDGKTYWVISDYNNVGPRTILWNNEYVLKFHRNFETIINSLINNKFELLQIEESKADERAVTLQPKYANQIHRPYFLFVKARKK
ncbi:MAG: methyltransferase domain-containing protein [Clostridia bacterium]|nr:methyltransferase domain-containing protein [Clostridia bacterium]